MHAESVDTLIKRLETPPIELSPTLLNVLDCVCIMTHAIVNKEETRKLREISEIMNVNTDGSAMINTPFTWNAADDKFYFRKNSTVFNKISERYGMSAEELSTEFRRRVQILSQMYARGIKGFEQVQEVITKYYKKPEEILKEFIIKAHS